MIENKFPERAKFICANQTLNWQVYLHQSPMNIFLLASKALCAFVFFVVLLSNLSCFLQTGLENWCRCFFDISFPSISNFFCAIVRFCAPSAFQPFVPIRI